MKKTSFTRLLLTLALTLALVLSIGTGTLAASPSENYVIVNDTTTIDTTTTFTGFATHYNRRAPDNYSVGYYVEDGVVNDAYSLLAGSDTALSQLRLNLAAYGTGFSAVIAKGAGTDLTLTGKIAAYDNSDGFDASDFSGLGAMIIAGDDATVRVNKMNIYTEGFLRAAFIVDDYASMIVKNSNITTMGANPLTDAYPGYANSADQNIMMSPPWVLGIQGGARSANVLGNLSTLTVIDSKVTSGAWAVLSTDDCTNPVVNVVDSKLVILPESEGGMSSGNFDYSPNYGSGYGTYIIGGALENFYGAAIKGTTYASILTGGTGNYMSSAGSIDLMDAEGNLIENVTGKGKVTTIQSVFGFMAHNNGTINVLDGTVVKTEEATFLYKAGDVTFTADEAVLKPASGIILQMIDNDDATVGVIPSEIPGPPFFNTAFAEDAGWPSENGNVTTIVPDDNAVIHLPFPPFELIGANYGKVNLNLSNGAYVGDVFNGTGYYGQVADALTVTISDGASLKGAISKTETIHVDENGDQNTAFTINEYYYLGHVANQVYNNANSKITVNVASGSTWTVTGESLISSLTVNGSITAPVGYKVVMTVGDTVTPIVSGQTYLGDIAITIVKGK